MTQAGGSLTNGETGVDTNSQLEASPSDSDSGSFSSSSSYGGGSSSSQSSSNEGVVFPNEAGTSSGSAGETISDSEDVRSKIDQLRTVAILLKRKADDLEASL